MTTACPKCGTEYVDGENHDAYRCRDALLAQLTHEREARAKAEAECERLREHARIVSDAAAAGVMSLSEAQAMLQAFDAFSSDSKHRLDEVASALYQALIERCG